MPDCNSNEQEDDKSEVSSNEQSSSSSSLGLCKNGAQCVSKLFDNECIKCKEPFYGKYCEFKSNDIVFDPSRKSNLTIKLLNEYFEYDSISSNVKKADYKLSFNFKPDFDLMNYYELMPSLEEKERLLDDIEDEDTFKQTQTADTEAEIEFLYLFNNQTGEYLQLSFTLAPLETNSTTTATRQGYLNLNAKNAQNNLLNIKNFIKKPLINKKFYKLNLIIKPDASLLIIKLNELNLNLRIEFKYEAGFFNKIVFFNNYYGVINFIKLNNHFINFNTQQQQKQLIYLKQNQYAIIEQSRCLFDR